MRILVTGGGGFAGRHLLRELLRTRDADRVLATALGETPVVGEELAGVEWLPMDLADPSQVEEVVGRAVADVVYHLAGQASVRESLADPLATWEANATGTLRLLMALAVASRRPARVLVVSSAEVYGAVAPGQLPIGEDAPLRPTTPYGASKAAAEVAALQQGEATGIEVVIARAFNHFGPGQDDRFVLANWAAQLIRMKRGEAEAVLRVGNLEVVRDFLDVRDVVRGYATLMARGAAGGVYNVCSGEGRSLRWLVERMVEESGTGAVIEVDRERLRPADIPELIGDGSRLRGVGWSPTYPLEETLRDLLREAEGRRA